MSMLRSSKERNCINVFGRKSSVQLLPESLWATCYGKASTQLQSKIMFRDYTAAPSDSCRPHASITTV
jgi:hypothetical protein